MEYAEYRTRFNAMTQAQRDKLHEDARAKRISPWELLADREAAKAARAAQSPAKKPRTGTGFRSK
jgi:hypothetical protein